MTTVEQENLKRSYFQWLCRIASGELRFKHQRYSKLLTQLHNMPFEYTIPLDGNRAEDGIDLRYRFGRESSFPDQVIASYLDVIECSILEMIAALALRMEEHIMSDQRMGNRTGQWFWDMINSLGLHSMDDDHYNEDLIFHIIRRFINREYMRNGKGGLFTLTNNTNDMRGTEIWYQMSWYLNEIT